MGRPRSFFGSKQITLSYDLPSLLLLIAHLLEARHFPVGALGGVGQSFIEAAVHDQIAIERGPELFPVPARLLYPGLKSKSASCCRGAGLHSFGMGSALGW